MTLFRLTRDAKRLPISQVFQHIHGTGKVWDLLRSENQPLQRGETGSVEYICCRRQNNVFIVTFYLVYSCRKWVGDYFFSERFVLSCCCWDECALAAEWKPYPHLTSLHCVRAYMSAFLLSFPPPPTSPLLCRAGIGLAVGRFCSCPGWLRGEKGRGRYASYSV